MDDYIQYQQEIDQEEYETRDLYFKVDYRGSFWCPTSFNFHPNLWKGTQAVFDKMCRDHFWCHEDEFKIIGVHTFNTYEEYLEKYKNLY